MWGLRRQEQFQARMQDSGTIRTPDFVTDIAEVVKKDPSKSREQISKEMDTSKQTIKCIINLMCSTDATFSQYYWSPELYLRLINKLQSF